MDGDDGVSKKSRTQGQRKTTWTPQNKTVNLFFFFQNHTIDSICYICVGGKAFSFFMNVCFRAGEGQIEMTQRRTLTCQQLKPD